MGRSSFYYYYYYCYTIIITAIVSITKYSNMIGYQQPLSMTLIIISGRFRSKLSDLTCPTTNMCNWMGQIGQLSSQ